MRVTPRASERRGRAASLQPVAGVPSRPRVLGAPVDPLFGSPRAAGETTRAPALTLSSWATWAFCRYMEYSTAVTTELVPSKMNWASDGRDPLSMATASSACRLEATRDPYAVRKPFPESVGPAPVDDEAIPEVETAQETGRRRCRGDGDVAAASWETDRIPGGSQGASASDSMTLSVPHAGRSHVGALPPGF